MKASGGDGECPRQTLQLEKLCGDTGSVVGAAAQNSALGAFLALAHFPDPLTAVPCAISACVHSLMGSAIAGAWRWGDVKRARAPRPRLVLKQMSIRKCFEKRFKTAPIPPAPGGTPMGARLREAGGVLINIDTHLTSPILAPGFAALHPLSVARAGTP